MALCSLVAATEDELRDASGEIHDGWYDTDDIAFEATAAVVVVPFRHWYPEELRPVGPQASKS